MNRLKFAKFPDSNWDLSKSDKMLELVQPHPLSAAAYVCADPILNTLILRYPIAGLASEYTFTDPNTGFGWYAYSCRAVLAAAQKPSVKISIDKGIPHA